MRFGLFTMPEHPPRENWTLSFDRDIDEIVLAEKLGFDEYWIGEHRTGGFENVPAPELMIAKASALTGRIHWERGSLICRTKTRFSSPNDWPFSTISPTADCCTASEAAGCLRTERCSVWIQKNHHLERMKRLRSSGTC